MSVLLGALCAVSVPAQTLDVGGVSGPWSQNAAPAAGFTVFDNAPLLAAAGVLSVPAGSGALHWDAFTAQAYGVGWHLSGPGWSNRSLVGFVPPTTLTGYWGTNRFTWALAPSVGAFTIVQTDQWVFGAFDVQVQGPIQILGGLTLSQLHGGVRALFAGLPWAGFFVGGADASLDSSLTVLGTEPLQASGSLGTEAGGLWARESWTAGSWSFDLAGLGGLLWAPSGSWQITTQSVDVTLIPPAVTVVSSSSDFRFEADPAWGVLLRLAATWQPPGNWKATVSRWLGWTGGWRVLEGSAPVSSPASSLPATALQSPSNTWQNLLLAGTGIDVAYGW